MKKLFYFITSLIILSSCVFGISSYSYFDNMIQGTWQINNEPRLVTFSDTLIDVDILFNVHEFDGIFRLNLIQDDHQRWIWDEVPDYELSINWKINGKTGTMIYICHVYEFENESIIVTGFPFSSNQIDTLHRIQIFN